MEVRINKHAVIQYQKKMFDFDIPEEEVVKILTSVAKKGTRVHARPTSRYPIYEIKHKKLSVVAEVRGDKIIVITFLGDDKYQSWFRKKDLALRYA